MLAGLFEQSDQDFQFQFDAGPVVPAAPSSRNETRLAGLWNQGSTCFLNVSLQVLAFIPELREKIMKITPEEFGPNRKGAGAIPLELQRLFAKLMLEDQQAMSSEAVTNSFGWDRNQVTQQEDAQELLQLLFQAIQTSLKQSRSPQIIDDMFSTKTVRKIKCLECQGVSETEGEELGLFVQVAGCPDGLTESLSRSFCSVEKMEGEERYSCSSCQTKTEAEMTVKLRTLPPVLMMMLQRFYVDPTTMRHQKVKDSFPYPFTVDLSRFTEQGQEGESIYELAAVIVHRGGSAHAGHYFSFIRDVDGLGHWDMPARKEKAATHLTPRPVDTALVEKVVGLLKAHSPPMLNISHLAAIFAKKEGISWNKAHKKDHGPFSKFLQKHPEWFDVRTDWVSLSAKKPLPLCVRVDNRAKMEQTSRDKSMGAEKGSGDMGATSSCDNEDDVEKETPAPEGYRWFCFNDEKVTPALESDVKAFKGDACAYLLFYRLKSLARPLEAKNNPVYAVPQYLIDEVEQNNRDLDAKREERARQEQIAKEEEERKKQEIEVEIRFGCNYRVENGMLQTDASEPLTIRHPRKETMEQLMDTILVLSTGTLEASELHVHRMKCWGEKTHLFEEITDVTKTAEELSLEDGSILFAWNGRDVQGQPVPTGKDTEPLALKLRVTSSSDLIQHYFPKNMSLEDFKTKVSELTGIEDDALLLRFPQSPVAESGVEALTLGDLSLQENSNIFVESKAPTLDVVHAEGEGENAEFDMKIPVTIQNCCSQRNEAEDEIWDMEIEMTMTVEEVKQLFMTMHCIQSVPAILRPKTEDGILQCPYDPSDTVAHAGITAYAHLLLEPSEIVINYKVLQPPSPGMSGVRRITLNKTHSVAQSLQTMAETVGLRDPLNWHLCRTNFFGDKLRDGVLSDLDLRLEQCSVQPGDLLILEPGRLPARGCVILDLWLYPTTPNLDHHLHNSLLKIRDMTISDTTVAPVAVNQDPRPIGKVEIKQDSNLEDLRKVVAELLMTQGQSVKVSQLRFRMIEAGLNRLRRVLRDPKSSLRHLKDQKSRIGVEVVNQAAQPLKEQLLLNVLIRDQETKTYSPPQELVWDTRAGTSACSLREAIAARLAVPSNRLVIAKHFPSMFAWKILDDSVLNSPSFANTSGKKGKKHAARRSNIRHKPFCVDDGDVIGVIRLNEEVLASVDPDQLVALSPDQFATVEDEHGKAQLLQEQQKKHAARANRSILDLPWTRRPTIPMKITVKDCT